MYYILNGSNQIVAVDNRLLDLCGTSDISELTLKIALNDTKFVLTSDTELTLTHRGTQRKFPISKTYFSSFLGSLTMIEIGNEIVSSSKAFDTQKTIPTVSPKKEETVMVPSPIIKVEKVEDDISALWLDDESEEDSQIEDEIEDIGIEFLHALEEDKTPVLNLTPDSLKNDKIQDETSNDYSALFNIEEEKTTKIAEPNIPEETEIFSNENKQNNEDYSALFNLSDENPQIDTPKTEIIEEIAPVDEDEIPIDVTTLSQAIGISEEDYDVFLDEYIDTALNLEEDLRGEIKNKQNEAISTLSHLSDVLHLPILHDKITKIEQTSLAEQTLAIDNFYNALSRISPFYTHKKETLTDTPMESSDDSFELELDLDTPIVEPMESNDDSFELELDLDAPIAEPMESNNDSFELELDLDAPTIAEPMESNNDSFELELDLDAPTIAEPTQSSDDLFELDLDLDATIETPTPTIAEPTQSSNDLFELDLDLDATIETPAPTIAEPTQSSNDLFELDLDLDAPIETPAPTIPEPTQSSDDLFELDLDLDAPIESPAPTIAEPTQSNDDLFEVEEAPLVEEKTVPISQIIKESKAVSSNSFGTLNMDGIKPIHFDFQVEEAANDLSLPVELIEEFVNDFIDQAKEETVKMLEAYEEGDLDKIQKIGHLLKGTSSNLRIKPLADTLYKIQFCEESSQLEYLIKDYWGHFLSFEIQIKALAH